MNATALIADLYRAGVKIEPRGDRLHIEAPSDAITPELKAVLTEHKVALLAALSDPLRIRLVKLASADGIDVELIHRLPPDEVDACEGYDDNVLTAYVRGLRDSDLRQHGKVPPDETARALCRHCGPVWVASEVAAVAPIVDGMPTVLACPWCFVRNRGHFIPHSPTTESSNV